MKARQRMKIPLAKPVFNEEMREAALNALENERFVLGESVYKFEEEFARYCGTKYAVSTSSGTNALQLSLIALDVKNGDEVITSPTSFVASANCVIHANATPKFADIDPETYTIDPRLIEEKITPSTKAIIPVHIFGYPADMKPIIDIAEEHGIKVTEDAAQAHGAEYHEKKIGAIGDTGCFSFYPSKNLTVCGDGGMVTTNDKEVAEMIAKLRHCGRAGHYEHDVIGFTSRLNTVNAAIGRVQLRKLDTWNEQRRSHAKLYNKLLSDLDEITTPPSRNAETKPVYHLYVVTTKARDGLKEWLEQNGVQCGVHYPIPIHLQPIYRELYGYSDGDFPRSELLSKECLSLPMFPQLKKEEIRYICDKVKEHLT